MVLDAPAPAPHNTDDAVTRSSGNVFADLGLPNAEDELLKARLVVALRAQVERLGLSQTKAAKLMGVSQPDVSKLLRGRVGGYSLERLLEFMRALGSDVEIRVKPPTVQREGRMSLHVALEPA